MDTYSEKRFAPRFEGFFHIKCKIVREKENKSLDAISENISEKGIRIFLEEPLSIGTKVSVAMNLTTDVIKTDAEVVWCSKEKFTEQFSVGLRFLSDLKDFNSENLKKNPIFEYDNISLASNNSKLKKLVDIVFSLLFLFLLMPLILLVCLLIKIDSPGPVFFKQWRAGRGGKRFLFYKFRSMYKDAPSVVHKEYAKNLIIDSYQFGWIKDEGVYKLIKDSRITKIGHILRKLSIDEIPQFFNVLKRDMSIVGPRPPILYELEFYSEKARKRLTVKPGLTGLWQISGRSSTTFEKMVELDLEYINRWSIILDIKIILKTVLAISRVHEAY